MATVCSVAGWQVRPRMASGKLTTRRMEVSHYSAPRRNGCVIIAQAGPAVGAHRAVAVIQRDPVHHRSSSPGSRGAAVPLCAPRQLGINLAFRGAQGRKEGRLSLAQQPVQVRAALPGPPGSLLEWPGSSAAGYHCRGATGLGVAHTVLRRGLFRDAAALAAGWPADRDDYASHTVENLLAGPRRATRQTANLTTG